jgi:general secretion pathway protein J
VRRARQRGFTLLELMIALVLLALIMTVLLSALRLGASSWDAAERKVAAVAEREMAMRVVERQLALAMPVMHAAEGEEEHLAFEGGPDAVSWVSPLPAHRGGGGVQYMRLALGETDRGRGLVLTWRLFHPDVMDAPAAQVEDAVLLMEGVEGLHLSYLGAPDDDNPERREWFDRWDHENRMPDLIRLTLDMEDPSAREMSLVAEPRQGAFGVLDPHLIFEPAS